MKNLKGFLVCSVTLGLGACSSVSPRLTPTGSAKLIGNVISGHRDAFRSCYDNAVRSRPGLRGEWVVDFTIEKSGTVSNAAMKTTPTKNSLFDRCLLDQFKKMSFPEVERTTRVTYPILFAGLGKKKS